MERKKSLKEYLNKLERCNDIGRLLSDEFKIYDNWPVLLYGNQDELFRKAREAFTEEDYPDKSWHLKGTFKDGTCYLFENNSKTGRVQINKGMYWEHKRDKIKGLKHSVWVMFHPGLGKGEGIPIYGWEKSMALSIVDFGKYIIKNNLTARFPKNGLNINYIPD